MVRSELVSDRCRNLWLLLEELSRRSFQTLIYMLDFLSRRVTFES